MSVAPAAKPGKKVHSNGLHKGMDATNTVATITSDETALRFALAKDVESAQHLNGGNFRGQNAIDPVR